MNAIRQALDAYKAGRLDEALTLLGGPQASTTLDGEQARTEALAAAGWPEQAAVADWVALAQARIRRELGEDLVAVVPVELALRTALGLLHDSGRLDAGLRTATTPPGGP